MSAGATRARSLAGVSALCVAVIGCAMPFDAHAQTLRPTVTTDGPLPPLRTREAPKHPRLRTVPSLPDDVVQPADAVVHGSSGEQSSRPAIRGPAGEAASLPVEAASSIPSALTVDGEFIPELGEDAEPASAGSSSVPPPGIGDFDPELFQAEVEPILDRRPARLYRFEPWQQRGIKAGSFVVLPEVETGVAGLSNVLRGTPARSDTAAYLRPAVRLRSDWRTHALELGASGNLSSFEELSSENDKAYRLEGRGRLDVMRGTNVELLGSHDVAQEVRGRIDTRDGARSRNDVTTDRAAASFNTRLNRFELQLRGAISAQAYDDRSGGVPDPGRDVTEREAAVRVGWQFKPTLTAFAEVGSDRRAHSGPSASDGIRRDSDGERYRAGLSFGNRGNILRGEVSAGWARQTPDDVRLGEIEGMIVDANLAWRIDGLNAVLLLARSDISETTLAGSSGALERGVGVEWRHAFLRPLIGTAGVAYSTRDYQGVDVRESDVTAAVGLEYYLGPEAMVFGRYEHTAYDSSVAGGDWTNDEVRIGLRVRR